VRLLVEHGAIVDERGAGGMTALLLAIEDGHSDVCEALLLAKADIEQCHPEGFTPLMAAARCGHLDVVKLLICHKAAIDRLPDPKGDNALTCAARCGHCDIVGYLIKCGASAVPPRRYKKWRKLGFEEYVDPETQSSIRELLRENKHKAY